MKLKWHGHSCFELNYADGTALITDPFDASVGYPVCTARADVVTMSHAHHDHNHIDSIAGNPVPVTEAGETIVCGAKITGIPAFHDECEGAKRGKNMLFVIEKDGLRVAHLGDLGHPLSDEQVRALGKVDVLLIPIGGFYTIDTPTAIGEIRKITPHTAIAMHFNTEVMNFPISDEKEFMAQTGAVYVDSNEIEFTPETLDSLPAALVMQYR